MFLCIRVPSVKVPGNVVLSVETVFAERRQTKRIETVFTFYRPLPRVRSVKWRQICHEGRSCIVITQCPGGVKPREDLIPTGGRGTVTVVIDFPPETIQFSQADGSLSCMISLSSYGTFRRFVYGDGASNEGLISGSSRVAIEFNIPDLFAPEENDLTVSMHPLGEIAPLVAIREFMYFDNSVSITCYEGCEGSAKGNGEMSLALKNFPASSNISIFDQVAASFGSVAAKSMELVEDHEGCEETMTRLRLVTTMCDKFIFTRRSLVVSLSLAVKGDPRRGSSTSFV